jgi:hypothetical protein
MKIKPEFLKKDGKTEFVILTYGDFKQLQELAEDAEDLKSLRAAKARQGGAPRTSLAEMKRLLRPKKSAS